MDDPFNNARRAKAIADAKASEKSAHEQMVQRATEKGALAAKPKAPERPFIPSRPPWASYG